MSLEDIVECVGGARIEPVPVPHDCRDGFYHAFWRRPAAYLHKRVRAGISVFALLDNDQNTEIVNRLRADLQAGVWEQRNAELLDLAKIDLGYTLIVAELESSSATRE